jgi:hypothetical protein
MPLVFRPVAANVHDAALAVYRGVDRSGRCSATGSPCPSGARPLRTGDVLHVVDGDQHAHCFEVRADGSLAPFDRSTLRVVMRPAGTPPRTGLARRVLQCLQDDAPYRGTGWYRCGDLILPLEPHRAVSVCAAGWATHLAGYVLTPPGVRNGEVARDGLTFDMPAAAAHALALHPDDGHLFAPRTPRHVLLRGLGGLAEGQARINWRTAAPPQPARAAT